MPSELTLKNQASETTESVRAIFIFPVLDPPLAAEGAKKLTSLDTSVAILGLDTSLPNNIHQTCTATPYLLGQDSSS